MLIPPFRVQLHEEAEQLNKQTDFPFYFAFVMTNVILSDRKTLQTACASPPSHFGHTPSALTVEPDSRDTVGKS